MWVQGETSGIIQSSGFQSASTKAQVCVLVSGGRSLKVQWEKWLCWVSSLRDPIATTAAPISSTWILKVQKQSKCFKKIKSHIRPIPFLLPKYILERRKTCRVPLGGHWHSSTSFSAFPDASKSPVSKGCGRARYRYTPRFMSLMHQNHQGAC